MKRRQRGSVIRRSVFWLQLLPLWQPSNGSGKNLQLQVARKRTYKYSPKDVLIKNHTSSTTAAVSLPFSQVARYRKHTPFFLTKDHIYILARSSHTILRSQLPRTNPPITMKLLLFLVPALVAATPILQRSAADIENSETSNNANSVAPTRAELKDPVASGEANSKLNLLNRIGTSVW